MLSDETTTANIKSLSTSIAHLPIAPNHPHFLPAAHFLPTPPAIFSELVPPPPNCVRAPWGSALIEMTEVDGLEVLDASLFDKELERRNWGGGGLTILTQVVVVARLGPRTTDLHGFAGGLHCFCDTPIPLQLCAYSPIPPILLRVLARALIPAHTQNFMANLWRT